MVKLKIDNFEVNVPAGTTILEAARKAKFTAGEREQVGSITYNFKLN